MSGPRSTLTAATVSPVAFSAQSPHWNNSVLGALCFATASAAIREADSLVPCLQVPLQRLDGGDSVYEVWHGNDAPQQGQRGAVRYRHDGKLLFGVIALPESSFAAGGDKTPLQKATEKAYHEVFELLDALGYPHLIRCWNYLADINVPSFGLERYRQFNLGRQAAFAAHGREGAARIPAASALGTARGPLNIAILAGREAPLCIENPRQVSAYQYPSQYGPRSPMFSRAAMARLPQQIVLFVSGTASIVGHQTMHVGDVSAQVRETIANYKAVLAETRRLAPETNLGLSDLCYRVYVRNATDYAPIRDELRRCVGDALNAVYLQADVCRSDLLVEIEASAVWSPTTGGQG